MTKRDIHQEITDRIIAAIEAGTAPWTRDWQGGKGKIHMPRRSTGEYYNGINVLLLWMTAEEKGYGADQWMTFNQAKKLGGSVRKGERSTQVVYYSTFERELDDGEKVNVPFLRSYNVFNVQQIDNLPASFTSDIDAVDTGARPIEEIEAFFAATGASITADGTQPRYNWGQDRIYMPKVQQFQTAESYYGTLAHELIHWTGHKTRLDRFKIGHKKEDYAFEELIAELGACYLTSRLGTDRGVDRSAAYIESWLQALRNDKKYIFKAASAASKATEFAIVAADIAEAAQAA